MAAVTELVHATTIALQEHAALIRGPSGCGKSDVALRCLAQVPFGPISERVQLVADDQTLLRVRGDNIVAQCPPTIAGKLEVRGLGITDIDCTVDEARVILVCDYATPDAVSRLPEDNPTISVLGRPVRHLKLNYLEASAAVKLLLALANEGARLQ